MNKFSLNIPCEVCGKNIAFRHDLKQHKGFHACSDACTQDLDVLIQAKDSRFAVHQWMLSIYSSCEAEADSGKDRNERTLAKIKFYLTGMVNERPDLISLFQQSTNQLNATAPFAVHKQN